MTPTSRRSTGLALALLSAATFGTSGTLGSSLIDAGWTPAAAVTARVGLAALLLTPVALVQMRGRWGQLPRAAGLVAAYGLVAVAGCQLAYFSALEHVSVGVALLLEYLGGVLVVGWMWLRHGQRPHRLTAAGAATAVAGLVLVLDLTGPQRVDLPGLLWGLGAAVGLAAYFVLSSQRESPLPPLVLTWGGTAVGAVALAALGAAGVLPMRAPRTDVVLLGTSTSWVVPVLCLSLVAAVVAYAAGIAAARRLGATAASFLGLTEVLFAVAFAWLLLGQAPAAVQLAGGVLVVAGVALVRLDEARRALPVPAVDPVADPATGPAAPAPAAAVSAHRDG